ncbi:MAG: hypothetical protein V1727_04230 [Candidatus Omnitrophota bacterium]
MKKGTFLCVLLVLGLVALAVPVVSAQEETMGETAEVSLQEVAGMVVAVNLDERSITVQTPAADETQPPQETVLLVGDSTLIGNNQIEMPLADLPVGAKVYVNYSTDENGKAVASTITVENQN